MPEKDFKFTLDGRTLEQFFWDRGPVSIIQGPVGSGTSTACTHRIWCQSMEQKPDQLQVRKTRWYIVRNTFNELKQTTLKTWKYWMVEKAQGKFGDVKMTNPPEHTLNMRLPDGSVVNSEVLFLALDNPDDKSKLLSAEMTGVWFNEAQFAEKELFDAAHARAMQGRYPPLMDGGPSWKGVIADLNAPPEGHWIPYMRGDVPLPDDWDDDQRREYTSVEGWTFYTQPPGLIEVVENGRITGYKENTRENRVKLGKKNVDFVAENTKWLPESYENLIKGKSKAYIDTFVLNRVGMYKAGQPVYQGYQPDIHVAHKRIDYNPHIPLILGFDFARNPAMVAIQCLRGQLMVLDEYGVENEAATTYAPLFKQRLVKMFPDAITSGSGGIQMYGDPTGGSKGQATDMTPFMIFRKHGLNVVAAPGNNNVDIRINAVQEQLNKMIDGRPGLLISPECTHLKGGFGGGYHFAKIKGTNAHQDVPNKRVRYADFHDALQYAALGAGLGNEVVFGIGTPKPQPMRQRKRYSLRR